MPRHVFTVVVAAAVASCAQSPDPRQPTAPMRLVLADSVDHVDALAREPMVVQHPSGALFVSGYGAGGERRPSPHLWKSVGTEGICFAPPNLG